MSDTGLSAADIPTKGTRRRGPDDVRAFGPTSVHFKGVVAPCVSA